MPPSDPPTTATGVRFADLSLPDGAERRALIRAIEAVLDHGQLINGPEVAALEERLAVRAGRRHAIGLASGTEALILGLRALGIGPGDEVITSSVSWVATANAIHLVGATPVFADIDDTYTIAPESVRRLLSARTRAILAVHYAGRPYDAPAIDRIVRERGLYHVEDASQAFGGVLADRPVGGWGDVVCCSANPMKLMAALGEAGFVLCDDDRLRDRLLRLRYNGVVPGDLICREPSANARLDTVQAAALLERLKRLDAAIAYRERLARRYRERLNDVGVFPPPLMGTDARFLFPIRITGDRDGLVGYLNDHRIEARSRATDLLRLHPPYQHCRGEWTRATALMDQTLFLPMHGRMSLDDVDRVSDAVVTFVERG